MSLLGLVHLTIWVAAGSEFANGMLVAGSFIPARFLENPISSSYSLASYSLLHGSAGHLVNNCVWLIAFGSPIASALGILRFTVFWIVCASAAALVHFAAGPNSTIPMIGASGAVSGLMGAVVRSGFRVDVQLKPRHAHAKLPSVAKVLTSRSVLVFLLVYLLINLAIGVGQGNAAGTSAIAWQAHMGGVSAGFLLLPLFVSRR